MQHRGSLLDLFGVIVITLMIVFGFFLASTIYSAASAKYASVRGAAITPTETQIWAKGLISENILLNMIPFIVFGAIFGAIVLAFMIPSHPIFFPMSILLILLAVTVATIYSDVMYAFLQDTHVAAIATAHPLAVYVVKYLPHIIAAAAFLISIVMYSRAE